MLRWEKRRLTVGARIRKYLVPAEEPDLCDSVRLAGYSVISRSSFGAAAMKGNGSRSGIPGRDVRIMCG